MFWKKLKLKLRYNRKRSLILIFLILLLCSFGVGYAFLGTELSIEGTSKFHEASWDVHFANLQVKSGSVTPTTAATITNLTTVTFAARLENPNDFYEFNVDVVNAGTLRAMIDEITILPELTTEQKKYLDYTVSYSDGTELDLKQELNPSTTETLTVHFSYIENVDTSNYPTEDQSFEVSLSITYVQADDTAIEVDHPPVIETKYTVHTSSQGTVRLGEAIPNAITQYDSFSEATAASGKPIAFKYLLSDGIVTESYVVFEVTSAIASNNTGMTVGVYELRSGGATYDPSTGYYNYDSQYYATNKATIQSAIPSNYCMDQTNSYQCVATGLNASAGRSGDVGAGVSGMNCDVYTSGSSYCSSSPFG